jgi:prepilin-type N-terminal cleavage/methylation domain-containing protein
MRFRPNGNSGGNGDGDGNVDGDRRSVPPANGVRPADGFTLIELLIVVAIIAILTALATAGLLRSKAAANEASAIQNLRVTSTAQKAYAVACGRGGYAASYLVLGAAAPGGGPGFVSLDLGGATTPLRLGYRYSIVAGRGSVPGPSDCNGTPTITAFYGTAVPLSIFSGARSFALDADGAIWQLPGGTAPPQPFGAPATMIQ